MLRNKLTIAFCATVFSISWVAASPGEEVAASNQVAQSQSTLVSAPLVRPWTHDVVLSEKDDAVLHCTFFQSETLAPEAPLDGADSQSTKVVSITGIVSVREAWEQTLTQVFAPVNADASENLTMEVGFTGGGSFLVLIQPVGGREWRDVRDVEDLVFTLLPQ